MASEAKIGLLLGLVIIFVIAFVLNELPRFGYATDSEPPDSTGSAEPAGLGANLRDHLEANSPAEKQVVSSSHEDTSEEPATYVSLPVIPAIPPEPPMAGGSGVTVHESVKKVASDVYYVVAEGDNLADIAKKFYGPIEGNRRANVLRIFMANRKSLASPHKIRIGQKLVIPRLVSSPSDEIEIGSVFPSWMFENVESIGKRHLSADNPAPKRNRQYVVREGDNLWHVAAAQLGDPTRYKEISRLNTGILEDEDTLLVGMRLNLPAQ
ncbi:MAG: LysM peptidoglycan-binding domain-containing protein [Planctomycetota bacterium]|jgi:nucleoid-associated protein YgaU